jgi:hypothetical protein
MTIKKSVWGKRLAAAEENTEELMNKCLLRRSFVSLRLPLDDSCIECFSHELVKQLFSEAMTDPPPVTAMPCPPPPAGDTLYIALRNNEPVSAPSPPVTAPIAQDNVTSI